MVTTQMDEFEKLLEESFKSKLSVADVVRGLILKREKDGYLVDIGAKSEGFLPDREIPASMVDELKIGDCKEFYILKEDEDEKKRYASFSQKSCLCSGMAKSSKRKNFR